MSFGTTLGMLSVAFCVFPLRTQLFFVLANVDASLNHPLWYSTISLSVDIG